MLWIFLVDESKLNSMGDKGEFFCIRGIHDCLRNSICFCNAFRWRKVAFDYPLFYAHSVVTKKLKKKSKFLLFSQKKV